MDSQAKNDSTISLRIEGMHCGMCVGRIEKSLGELEGVSEASVSLEDKKAFVRFDSGSVNTEDLIAAVVDAGYSASVLEE